MLLHAQAHHYNSTTVHLAIVTFWKPKFIIGVRTHPRIDHIHLFTFFLIL